MTCEWCRSQRDAVCFGMPLLGPPSRMCVACRDRICRKLPNDEFDAIPIEEHIENLRNKDKR